MTADDPFHLTIREHPDDDGPRLVYADWLEERGQCDRAELIRLQCGGNDNERVRDLIRRHGDAWAGPIAHHCYGMAFRRGFVEEITVDAGVLSRYGDALFAAAPIRLLRVIGAAGILDRFVRLRVLADVRALHLTGSGLNDASAAALAECKHLANLRTLRLGQNSIGDDGVESLANSPWLGKLETLVLDMNLIGDMGAIALASSHGLDGLRALDLSHNPIGDAGAEALAHAGGLCKLKHLGLSQPADWVASWIRTRLTAIQPKQRAALATRFGAEACVF
jgi:uncharacterized protein (TIGR02996 family)